MLDPSGAPQTTGRVILGSVGATLTATSVQRFIDGNWIMGIVLLVLAFVCVSIAVRWDAIRSRLPGWIKTTAVFVLTVLPYVAAFGVLIYIWDLRNDFDAYVTPRSISRRQAQALKTNLDKTEITALETIAVKVNAGDHEATEYAGQLFNALKETKYKNKITFDTSDGPPDPGGEGLNSHLSGTSKSPRTEEPGYEADRVTRALTAADILVYGSSDAAAGDYRLYLVVGNGLLRSVRDHGAVRSSIG